MKTRKLLSLVLALCMVFSIFSVCTAISVSAADAIEIATAEDLRKIGRDSAYPLSGSYVLTADIDLADEEWVPIGFTSITDTSPDYFTGTIDGQGHIISNMWTEDRTGETPTYRTMPGIYWGFVAKAQKFTIKNLGFKDVYANLGKSGNNTQYIATVVGRMEGGTCRIENVAVLSGTINVTNVAHKINVAGIATSQISSGATHKVINCYNGADIVAKHGNYSKYSSYASAAGILMIYTNNSNITVENCLNVGNISVTGYSNNTFNNYGGYIVTRQGSSANAVTCSAKLINNYSIDNCITLKNAKNLAEDIASTTTVYGTDVANAESYSGLTALTDSEGNALWTAVDGYYAIPTLFADHKKEAVAANYTLIETLDELKLIGVDEAYPANGYYKLANDIDASQSEWTPITTFSGLFEGNGYTVSGLNIGKTEAVARTTSAYGLFGTLSGTVRNLKLTDVYFNTYVSGGTSYLGAVAGNISGGKIQNVYADGAIIDSVSKNTRAGGLVGIASGAWSINDCFVDVDVTAGYSAAISGGTLGLAGVLGSAENSGSISDVISMGRIEAKYPGYVGAVVSHYYGLETAVTSNNCYSNADIDYYATANMKAFHSKLDKYTAISEYEMLCGALADKMSDAWTDDATDLAPYLNVFEEPAVASQTEEMAATAVEEAIRASVLTNYTNTANLTNIAEGVLELGSLKFAVSNFTLTPANTETEGCLELTFTVGEATRSITLSIAVIPAFDYKFSTTFVGRADGTVTVTDAAYQGKNFRLYWGDDNGALQGYDALATLNDFEVKDETAGKLTYTAITHTLIPETATKLYLAVDGNLVTEFSIPAWRILKKGELKYTSAHVSDTHFGYERSIETFREVLKTMREMGGTIITNSGDITDRGNEGGYNEYKTAHSSTYSDITFWPTLGNHDILVAQLASGVTDIEAVQNAHNGIKHFANPNHTLGDEFVVTIPSEEEETVLYKTVTNEDGSTSQEPYTLVTDYTMSYKDDMYVFMSVGKVSNSHTGDYHPDVAVSNEQLAWLEKVLNNYYNVEKKNGQAYFIFHFATLENGLGGDASSYKNYVESSAKLYEILDKYPVIHISGHTHYPFRNDGNIYIGTNHVALSTPSITKGHQAYEGYVIEHYTDYTLIKGYNFYTREYIPNAMFYIAEEYQCNPVVVNALGKANINATNGTKLTYTQTKVYDNRLIPTSENVFKITATAGNGYSGAYAFATIKLTRDTANNRNEMYGWKANNGDLRFYIKNDSEESLTFQPYIYAYSKYVDGKNHKYVQGIATKSITLPANSGWVEVRIPANGFTTKGNFDSFGKGDVDACRIGLSTTAANGFLNTKGGTVYVSQFEFHDHTLTSEITTEFDRPYKTQYILGNNYSNKVDSTGNITRVFADCSELPFATKATTLTAVDTYDYANLKSSTQLGLFLKYSNAITNLDLWAQNPDAELRFWIKTEKDTAFRLNLSMGASGYSTQTAYVDLTVKGAPDWQEVRVKSSALNGVSKFDTMIKTGTAKDLYVNINVKTNTFVAGQSIMFANRMEFFSHKAYAKGDITRDGVVNVKDLVRVKKSIANGATEFINGDIDADGALAASDTIYMRKWILYKNWTGESQAEPMKILFTGNSFTYWGGVVEERYNTNLNISTRQNDKGIFYQLCNQNGIRANVTNWTWPGHGLGNIFGESCTYEGCEGVNHLSYLTDRVYDYVVIQEGSGSKDSYDNVLAVMEIFKAANPDTKFIVLEHRSAHAESYERLTKLKELEAAGVTVVDWGDLVNDIIKGDTTVPGATLEYNKNSFVISKNANDGYHPNMLTGYITALMTYSAITGEKAEGQPYAFCDNSAIHSMYDLDAYYEKNYAYSASNFVEIFKSSADMKGIQQLIDRYLAEKPYNNF